MMKLMAVMSLWIQWSGTGGGVAGDWPRRATKTFPAFKTKPPVNNLNPVSLCFHVHRQAPQELAPFGLYLQPSS
jgi:hypothetical protein